MSRVAALWLPDWPAVVAMAADDLPAHAAAAVLGSQGVAAVSAAARSQGVARGMRKRQTQALCPHIHLYSLDEDRDSRYFEPVAAAAEQVVYGIEIVRPGLILIPAAGTAKFYGSEEALIEKLVAGVVAATGFEAQAGVADSLLAAVLAAREGVIVGEGDAAAYLASRPLSALQHVAAGAKEGTDLAALIDLWRRLGLYSLGDLATLPAADVAARFGPLGGWAHHLASGGSDHPPALRRVDAEIAASSDLDPPVERVDQAAFAAKRLADEVHGALVAKGLSCARLRITARTDAGVELERVWRTDAGVLGGLDAARMTDRVRWQLEGWLTAARAAGHEHEAQALTHLALAAEDVLAAGVEQGGLWGADSGLDGRAHRALLRVQGLLGADAVLAPVRSGGRDPRDQVQLVPWGQQAPAPLPLDRPWPGRLPEPSPTVVPAVPSAIGLVDHAGRDVEVSARLELSGNPAAVVEGRNRYDVVGWAGPWPLVERWWAGGARRVQLQLLLRDGGGFLVSRTGGAWYREATYD